MICVGMLVWAVLGALYFGLFGTAGIVFARRLQAGEAVGFLDCVGGAVLAAFLLAPAGFVALYVPVHYEGETLLKPRLIENMGAAYLLSLAGTFIVALAVLLALKAFRRPATS